MRWRIEGSSDSGEPSLADDDVHERPRAALRDGVVERRGLLVQGLVANVADDSDNGEGNLRLGAGTQGSADRVGVAEEFLGGGLADDHHQLRRLDIRVGEGAAAQQRDAHGVEVAVADAAPVDRARRSPAATRTPRS